MTCPACEARKTARRRGGVYLLGGYVDGVKIDPCQQCLKSHDVYSFQRRKEIKPIKGKK